MSRLTCVSNSTLHHLLQVGIIDLDWMQPESEAVYPLNFAVNAPGGMRHPDAGPGKLALRRHDCYALAWILDSYVPAEGAMPEQERAWSVVVAAVRDGELGIAVRRLETVPDCPLKAV